jgi:hypothetical protein
MLVPHGARAVLRAAELDRGASKPLDTLQIWVSEIVIRTHYNNAACALANKLARVCYAGQGDHTLSIQRPIHYSKYRQKLSPMPFSSDWAKTKLTYLLNQFQ